MVHFGDNKGNTIVNREYEELTRAELINRIEALRKEVEDCHAKSTCCCGDYIKDHSAYSGHTPVSMFDYYKEL